MKAQTDLKSMKKGVIWIENTGENLYKMLINLLNNTYWWNIRPTLDPSISGTKCDTDKPIFLQNERVNQKQGSSPWNLPIMHKYGSSIKECQHPTDNKSWSNKIRVGIIYRNIDISWFYITGWWIDSDQYSNIFDWSKGMFTGLNITGFPKLVSLKDKAGKTLLGPK